MSAPTSTPPGLAPLIALVENLKEVLRLAEIHEELSGTDRGRRFDLDVLNSSGVVLAVACRESFVEDLATSSFQFMLDHATSPSVFPPKVLVLASKGLRDDKDERRVWDLAGEGWRRTLIQHRDAVLRDYLGGFNTPRTENVNKLFENLIGLKDLSGSWRWHKNPSPQVATTLDRLIALRGQIAHRVKADRYVQKREVVAARELIVRLAVTSGNTVGAHVESLTGAEPWARASYRSAK
jgi:hypothetical protein